MEIDGNRPSRMGAIVFAAQLFHKEFQDSSSSDLTRRGPGPSISVTYLPLPYVLIARASVQDYHTHILHFDATVCFSPAK